MDSLAVKEHMRPLLLFRGLAEPDLERLAGMAGTRQLATGEVLMREGELGDTLYVVVEGELEVRKRSGTGDEQVAVRAQGEVVGEMAVLQQEPRSATLRALVPSTVLEIGREAVATLFSCSPAAALTIIRTMAERLKSTEALLVHQAKLAALGTMAAGLAHELNNPAAAMRRSTEQLALAVASAQRALESLAEQGMPTEQLRAWEALRPAANASGEPASRTGTAERRRREDELEAWLGRLGLATPWELAPALVTAGWTREGLEAALGPYPTSARPALVGVIAARAEIDDLLAEARMAADAVSRIVGAVKGYTYLDQAPVQEVDLHESLETTLVILRHKLREGVEIVREYAPDLPAIEALGSELNQVWTNLIDNAVDAMGGQGTLTLRTRWNEHEVSVEVQDTGPGVPSELRSRLFEPFFTTKEVGAGTGLGLHIAYSIVQGRHHGRLHLRSERGSTSFVVTLPRRLAAAT